MNQSISIVLLYLVNSILSLIISFYLAIDAGPEFYALVVIFQVVTSVMPALSFYGYEVLLIRNVLNWQITDRSHRISVLVNQTILHRIFFSIFISLPFSVFLYLSLVGFNKTPQFVVLFLFAGVGVSLLQSISLILKSFNKYFYAISLTLIGGTLTKVISLLAYLKFGLTGYFVAFGIVTILLVIVAIKKLSQNFRLVVRRFRPSFKLGVRKEFTLSSYFQYLSGNADRLIFPIVLSNELVSAYGLAKQIFELGKSLVEGVFDPLTQKVVGMLKGPEFNKYVLKLRKWSLYIAILGMLFAASSLFWIEELVVVVGLSDYKYLGNFLLHVEISIIMFLTYKVSLNIVTLGLSAKKLKLLNKYAFSVVLVNLLVVVSFVPESMLFIYRIFQELIMMILVYYFAKELKLRSWRMGH